MDKTDPNYYVAKILKLLKDAGNSSIVATCRFHGYGKNTTVSIEFKSEETGECASVLFEKDVPKVIIK